MQQRDVGRHRLPAEHGGPEVGQEGGIGVLPNYSWKVHHFTRAGRQACDRWYLLEIS